MSASVNIGLVRKRLGAGLEVCEQERLGSARAGHAITTWEASARQALKALDVMRTGSEQSALKLTVSAPPAILIAMKAIRG